VHDKLDTVFPMMTINLIQYTIKLQITIKNVSMTLQANRNNNKFTVLYCVINYSTGLFIWQLKSWTGTSIICLQVTTDHLVLNWITTTTTSLPPPSSSSAL